MKDFGLKTTFANEEKINHFLNKSHCVFLELFKWIALIKIHSLKLYCLKNSKFFNTYVWFWNKTRNLLQHIQIALQIINWTKKGNDFCLINKTQLRYKDETCDSISQSQLFQNKNNSKANRKSQYHNLSIE